MPCKCKYDLMKFYQMRWVNTHYFVCPGRGSFPEVSCVWYEFMHSVLSCIPHFSSPPGTFSEKSNFARPFQHSPWLLRWSRICLQCRRLLTLIPGSGRFPGEENGYPLQYSCLENPKDRGVWQATVHGVAKSQTWMKG